MKNTNVNKQHNLVLADDINDFEQTEGLTLSGALLTDDYLNRLQRTVSTFAGIPDGDELVHILGNGHEKSNFEAIETLITNLLDVLSELPLTDHFERVMVEIKNRFHDLNYLVTLY